MTPHQPREPAARTDPAEPRLRSDARRNRDQVLRAAREAFAESGFAVPLDEIARRAGVGPGTVYRHFPTKEALFGAVVAARVSDLVVDAEHRAADPDAGATFFSFLARLGREGAAQRDLSDAMHVPSAATDELNAALAVLLSRAQDAGAVRPDLTAADLVGLLKALLTVAAGSEDPGSAARIFAVLTEGLRPARDRG